ncbi:hypothetical protein DCAR_0935139 [Daucus carota subsp. sativus]|uniref:Uncharacterized protein n=1 Tax=Daucus carota subsp. sativus TaxID=79200 RepID=A0A175YG82_DAUCS|nr:PREDICTED: protein PLANT CADMIUM RESISTANCE 2-like [Daucus carota subsp. sativus]WOH15597.1 hypothetical protein DCAR_0935139 [Daucus carota subsp. sativus]
MNPASNPDAYGKPSGHQAQHSSNAPTSWSTGLFDCFSDVPNCCLTFWCPCVTFGQVADIVDKGTSTCTTTGALYALLVFVTGCGCCYSCFYRTKMRNQYMLTESPCPDFLVHCCCESCALCQEHRELRLRGFDMSLGWEGNMEKQNRGVAMAPKFEGGMNR